MLFLSQSNTGENMNSYSDEICVFFKITLKTFKAMYLNSNCNTYSHF